MNKSDLAVTKMQVDSLNKSLGKETTVKGRSILGKNDFLKLLMMQLTHQDPTKPMSDTAFISQMAQFSSLEQMTNISQGFKKLNEILSSGQALNLLGKRVEVADGKQTIEGVVKAISGELSPQLLVNGNYYNYADVRKVME
jgi:flagellar basal-body rod modification protein FlgD